MSWLKNSKSYNSTDVGRPVFRSMLLFFFIYYHAIKPLKNNYGFVLIVIIIPACELKETHYFFAFQWQ